MYDIIIIGAGPAGLSACLYASRAGLDVLLIEAGAPGGKLNVSASIENWPGQAQIAGPDLAYQMYEHTLSFGGKQVYGAVNKVVDHGEYKEVLTEDETYQAKNIIIASGTKERMIGLEKEAELTGRGISYCAVCDGPFFRGEEVAVIGGGNSALKESLHLATIVNKVHLIVRRDVFRGDKILQDRILKNETIEVHFLKKPHHIIEEDNKVAGLGIEDSVSGEISELPVKAIFPFVGLDPITSFVEDLGITNKEGYIITNEAMETTIPGIYGAGDVREKMLRQIVTASNDGAIAAQTIANKIHEQ